MEPKNKSLKSRVNDLENQQPDEAVKIQIDWSEKPDHSDLKPGDKVVEWTEDDQIIVRKVGKGGTKNTI